MMERPATKEIEACSAASAVRTHTSQHETLQTSLGVSDLKHGINTHVTDSLSGVIY